MPEEQLTCNNCGGGVVLRKVSEMWYFDCWEQNNCPISSVIINKARCPTKAEAIAAFKKATGAEIKSPHKD